MGTRKDPFYCGGVGSKRNSAKVPGLQAVVLAGFILLCGKTQSHSTSLHTSSSSFKAHVVHLDEKFADFTQLQEKRNPWHMLHCLYSWFHRFWFILLRFQQVPKSFFLFFSETGEKGFAGQGSLRPSLSLLIISFLINCRLKKKVAKAVQRIPIRPPSRFPQILISYITWSTMIKSRTLALIQYCNLQT